MSKIVDIVRSEFSRIGASNTDMALDILNPGIISNEELFELIRCRYDLPFKVTEEYLRSMVMQLLVRLIMCKDANYEPHIGIDEFEFKYGLRILESTGVLECTDFNYEFTQKGLELKDSIWEILDKLD